MTIRKPRRAAKAEEPSQENEVSKIPQEELENFFTDPTPEEVEIAALPPKQKSIPITNKVFLGEEDLRQWDKYRNFLYDQGVKRVRHKKI
jgi:hypothetical protein